MGRGGKERAQMSFAARITRAWAKILCGSRGSIPSSLGRHRPVQRPASHLQALGARARAVVWRDDGIARFGINCALVIGLNR